MNLIKFDQNTLDEMENCTNITRSSDQIPTNPKKATKISKHEYVEELKTEVDILTVYRLSLFNNYQHYAIILHSF